jgi:hypothetical protein
VQKVKIIQKNPMTLVRFFKDLKLDLIVFEKLTHACFFQIALETILLPVLVYLLMAFTCI